MTLDRILLLAGFILIIIFPTINGTFGLTENRNTEKRKNEDAPKLEFVNWSTWILKYDQHYKKTFPGRSIYFRGLSRLKYSLWRTSVLPDKVILGEKGFLFLGNTHAKSIDKKLGINIFTKRQLAKITQKIRQTKKKLAKENIKFYFAVAPDKNTIYPELLPFNVDPNCESPLKQLKRSLQNDLIDLSERLTDEEKKEVSLYYKFDTHWTPYGAFLAFQQLIATIRKDFPTISNVDITNYTIEEYVRCNKNLCEQLDLDLCENRYRMEYVNSNDIRKQKNRFIKPPQGNRNYEKRYINPQNKLKVLVFRDSFTTELEKFFNQTFGELVYIWTSEIDQQIIAQEQPDIVIFEIVERNLDKILNWKNF